MNYGQFPVGGQPYFLQQGTTFAPAHPMQLQNPQVAYAQPQMFPAQAQFTQQPAMPAFQPQVVQAPAQSYYASQQSIQQPQPAQAAQAQSVPAPPASTPSAVAAAAPAANPGRVQVASPSVMPGIGVRAPVQPVSALSTPSRAASGSSSSGGSAALPFVADVTSEDLGAGRGPLAEAFCVIAHRFAAMDTDNAKLINFKTIAFQLSLKGFTDREKLTRVFDSVEVGENGNVDFSDFLTAVYLWCVDNPPSVFIKNEKNVEVFQHAVTQMEQVWKRGDADLSRTISYDKLAQLFNSDFPELWKSCQPTIDAFYPPAERESAPELKFPRVLHLLYACLCKQPGNRLVAAYAKPAARSVSPVAEEVGRKAEPWRLFDAAFAQLERDFKTFDSEGEEFIDIAQITRAARLRPNAEREALQRRLQHKIEQVDLDRCRTLSFFQFAVLAYLMCLDGSYTDLLPPAAPTTSSAGARGGAGAVKLALLQLHGVLAELDHAGKLPEDMLITMGDACKFFRRVMGFEPPEIDAVFKEVRGATMTLQQLLQLVYWIVRPNMGKYNSRFYEGRGQPRRAPFEIDHGGEQQPRAAPIDRVRSAELRKISRVGEDAEGVWWLGSYQGQQVAVKAGRGGGESAAAMQREAAVMQRLDHPSCLQLRGAEAGGAQPVLLTEVCAEGSVFEVYHEQGCQFSEATAWRLALECAQGMEALHQLGFMHRDLNSLNVLLAQGFTAKVAGYGLATDKDTDTAPVGSIVWMAPEVMANFDAATATAYDRRCDIFSYAVLVYEIYNCKLPYTDLTITDQSKLTTAILHQQLRPTYWRPGRVNRDVRHFIARCWAQDPEQRPQTFGEIVYLLDEIRPAGFEC